MKFKEIPPLKFKTRSTKINYGIEILKKVLKITFPVKDLFKGGF